MGTKRWARHVAYMEENRRNTRILLGKLEEGNFLEGLGVSWWMVLKRTYGNNMERSGLD